MSRKQSCENTDYTSGFKIHREKDGTFVATKGKHELKAKSAEEIDKMIKNFIAQQRGADKSGKGKPEEYNVHDACVRTIAEDLKKENWLVKANAQGWEKPQEIGGIIPDVLANKGCLKQICHIVTEKDFEGDKARYRDFRNYCKEYEFHLYVVDKNGKPRQTNL